jgi:hypothetical protein
MPNWVTNSLTVTSNGDVDNAEMAEFLSLVGKEVPQGWAKDENGEDIIRYDDNGGFSFMAYVAPPADKIEEYFGQRGIVGGEQVGDTEYNWYNWNNDNWGCKWDCGEVYVHSDIESDPTEFHATFQTPWSPPEEFLRNLIERFPTLSYTLDWEEEQGFGAVWDYDPTNAEAGITITDQWEIPDCHEDYVNRDRRDSCICAWESDPNEWYDDCEDKAEEILRWNKENGIIDPNAQEPDLVY